MIDLMLETLGALAFIASIALKFVKPAATRMQGQADDTDPLNDAVSPSDCVRRRPGRAQGCGRARTRRGNNRQGS